MITDFYNATVEIKRLTHTDDDYGGVTNTWGTAIASYDCRIYSLSGKMGITDIGKIEGTAFKLAGDSADIRIGDKVVDGTDEYLVKSIDKLKKKTSTVNHLEIFLEKIK